MCAVSRVPENVSRTSVAFGVASLAILLTGFVTGSWVTTREPYRVPGTEASTVASFRIGLWKICPTLKTINSTFNSEWSEEAYSFTRMLDFRSLSCKYIRYTGGWDSDLAKEDVGIESDVYFTQSFVAKMRWCTPLVGISVCLMLAGCVFSFSGHLYKDQKTLIASSLHTLAGLILAAGLFVFASVLNDSFSPVVHQSVDGGDDDTNDDDDGFGGELRSEYDYRYGWSFVACSLAFLTSEASAVFTITAYFRRLEDHVQYTAVDRKPSPDTPPSAAGDRSSACSTDARADSPDGVPSSGVAATAEIMSRSSDHHLQPAAGRHHQAQCTNGAIGDCNQTAGGVPSSGVPATAEACNGTASKTPPDICPPKIGCDDTAAATISVTVPPSSAARLQSAASYCSATLNHHPSSSHSRHHQHYRQTLAVGGNGSCYEVDTTKPCTCGSAATTTTKRYATIAGVARHNGGKLQYTTTTTALTTAAASNNNGSGGGNKRLQVSGRSTAGGTALSAIKETVGGLADHHHLQHHVQHQQQQQQQQHHHHHHATAAGLHHRKPEPPTRRLKASVGGYVVPQTPIAALEALDCPPIADPRLVLPSSV